MVLDSSGVSVSSAGKGRVGHHQSGMFRFCSLNASGLLQGGLSAGLCMGRGVFGLESIALWIV